MDSLKIVWAETPKHSSAIALSPNSYVKKCKMEKVRLSRESLNPIQSSKSLSQWQNWSLVILAIGGVGLAIALSPLGDCHMWLKPPSVNAPFLLYLPALGFWLLLQIILRLSPEQKQWSRLLVVSLLLFLLGRYLLWRIFFSLNLSNLGNGIFSMFVLLLELLTLSPTFIQLCLLPNLKDRRQEAQAYKRRLLLGEYQPTVDILIPTYNEPDFILRRTLVGCQALEYPHKKIYLLDDTQRPEIEQLAQELDCIYITRPDNRHAKAGNLNHAAQLTTGELIVVFDADFIPTRNFLQETLGFFQNPRIALVQTPQTFYNPDPIARNLGLEDYLPHDEEWFYRQLEPMKDGAKAVLCSGTSFVVRRSALEAVGYFVTESVSEDYYTGIRLNAFGYESVYLNKKLSAGLAAENISTYISQRLRWGRGTLQSLFIPSSPYTIPGLSLGQRLAHLEGLLSWFTVLTRALFLFLPIVYSLSPIQPLIIAPAELIYVVLPYYLLQLSSWHWLSFRSRSIVISEVYSLISFLPLAWGILKILASPFQEGFKVTPKGLARNYYSYNWRIAKPLFFILTLTLISLGYNLSHQEMFTGSINLGLILGIYNLLTISLALIALLEPPHSEPYESFARQEKIKLKFGEVGVLGELQAISEKGASLYSSEKPCASATVLEIINCGLSLPAEITTWQAMPGKYRINLHFTPLTIEQQRQLIQFLYCQPGQWQDKNTPGELASLGLLIKSITRFFQVLIFQRLNLLLTSSKVP
jgi:cellulose synthase (UDP-forming)